MIGLAKGNLSTSNSTIFSNGNNNTVYIKNIILHNKNTSLNSSVTIYIVVNNSGSVGSATQQDQLFFKALQPNETFEISYGYPIELSAQGDSIQALSDTDGDINYVVGGVAT